MSLILERMKAKKALEQPEGITAGELLDKLYELINTNKIHTNTKIILDPAMYTMFMCVNCNWQNEKEYNKYITNWEVDEKRSTKNKLVFYIKTATGGNPTSHPP